MKLMLWLVILMLVLYMPDVSSLAARQALGIWGLDVIPSLFPYMVLCRMIANQLRQTNLPAFPVIAILGVLGGSPSGAAAISSYARQGRFSRQQLYSLCALTGTISPMFFLSTMRSWNIAPSVCRWLFISHIGGALLVFLCVWSFFPQAEHSSVPPHNLPIDSEASPIVQSVSSVLNVGGCIVFFSVIAACFSASLAWLPETVRASFHGLLEVAGGVHALSMLAISAQTKGLLLAMATGFSGFSILSQNAMFLKDCGVKFSHLVLLAFIRAVFSFCLMALFFNTVL